MPIVVLVVIAVVWLSPVAIVVGLCRSAAAGDRLLDRQTRLGAPPRRRRFTRVAARAL
jgi:hypothetical protein